MKQFMICLLIFLPLSVASKTTKEAHFISLERVHPTQAFIGLDQIPSKIKKIEKKYKKNKLTEYLKEKWTPAIIGPDNKYWIIDRHHLSYSILKSKIPNKKQGLFIKVIFDWSSYSWSYFKERMNDKSFLYLKDDKFKPITFEELPLSIGKLRDNPYRSLAYFAREKNCFNKVNVPFLEFTWGEYFYKKGISISDKINYKKPIKQALKLCKHDSARHLPGFISRKN
ncbi:ParB-like protein [Halobacteriovorax sp.]|uniref:ParB-like protein n=1 Tax=Halobacteriovorax sp. TaxID=2020862 RepID=UPI003569BD3E